MESIESELLDAKDLEDELYNEKHVNERDRLQEDAESKRKRDAEDLGWQQRLDESYKRLDVCFNDDKFQEE